MLNFHLESSGKGTDLFTHEVQYSPKIMHAQDLFASTSRQLLAASCGLLALKTCKTQELLCGRIFETRELLCSRIFKPQELLCANILARKNLYQNSSVLVTGSKKHN